MNNSIRKLIIKNFRSIENLELDLTNFNALIGPNSSGKSNILKALNLIVGETYPSIRSFTDHDFYLHDKSKEILIEVQFSNPLSSDPNVYGFRLTYNSDSVNYIAINKNGDKARYFNGNEMKISNKMRNEISMMFLPLDRQAHQQITSSQWKIYGKLLNYISSQIDNNTKNDFKTVIKKEFNKKIFPYVKNTEEMLKNFVKEQTGQEIVLKLYILDPVYILKDLRPLLKYSPNFEVDVNLEGAGIQSAVAIAIARVYAEVVRKPLILAIEEPELYLHPHGCRHFYKLLKDLAKKGVQIIYTTHERSFVQIENFDSICIVRKEGISTNAFRHADVRDSNSTKLSSKFNEELNEVFFADSVILVEGPSDKIACTLSLEKLEIDLNKENISIVECGGIDNIVSIAKILNGFKIKTYALVDGDPGNKKTHSKIQQIKNVLGDDKIFIQEPSLEGIFDFEKIRNDYKIDKKKFKKEIALEILPQWLKQNEPPEVYKTLKEKLNI